MVRTMGDANQSGTAGEAALPYRPDRPTNSLFTTKAGPAHQLLQAKRSIRPTMALFHRGLFC
jgi:hypothetical protein